MDSQRSLFRFSGSVNYLLILLGLLIFFVMIAFGYLVSTRTSKNATLNQAVSTPGPDGALPTPMIWPTYEDATYAFDYPPDWKVNAGSQEIESRFGGDYVQIVSPSPTVTIEIAPGPFSYEFAEGVARGPGDEVEIIVNGQKYKGVEDVRVEGGKTKVFVDIPVTLGSREYHVLFGTGYPVNADDKANSNQYETQKITITRILSTLRINQ
jgi:hypothetical protein